MDISGRCVATTRTPLRAFFSYKAEKDKTGSTQSLYFGTVKNDKDANKAVSWYILSGDPDQTNALEHHPGC